MSANKNEIMLMSDLMTVVQICKYECDCA